MVEGLIAEGYTPSEIAELVQRSFGMSAGDADLYVRTSLGLPGDVEIALAPEDVSAAGRPDVSELAMVALYPRPDEQKALAVRGGNPADTMHVTLVFFGEQDSEVRDAVLNALSMLAQDFAPLEGTIGGVGRFKAGEDGSPIILLPDVQGLASLRSAVADALEVRGVVSPSEHGWMPHLTLRYAGEDELDLPDVPDVPLHFDSISYVEGDRRTDFPLEG